VLCSHALSSLQSVLKLWSFCNNICCFLSSLNFAYLHNTNITVRSYWRRNAMDYEIVKNDVIFILISPKRQQLTETKAWIHTPQHTQKKHSNRQTNNQSIYDRKAKSLGWVIIMWSGSLICSISYKQWTQTICRYNKIFAEIYSGTNIDLSLNRHEIKIRLTFFDNRGRRSPKKCHEKF